MALSVAIAAWPGRQAAAQSIDIPLQLVPEGSQQRLQIIVGIGGGAPKPYLFDTGSSSFNAAYNPVWFPAPTSVLASGLPYVYSGGGPGRHFGYILTQVTQPTLSFYASTDATTQPSATLPSITPGYQLAEINDFVQENGPGQAYPTKIDGHTYYINDSYTKDVADDIAPSPVGSNQHVFYGTFGAGDFVSTIAGAGGATTVSGVLGQATKSGYVVAANGQGSAVPGTCSPCVILGLTPALRAQFTSRIPWNLNGGLGASFSNSHANGSNEFGVTFNYALSGNSLTPAVWTGSTLLDSGTANLGLNPTVDARRFTAGRSVTAGTTLSITGNALGAQTTDFTITSDAVPITYNASVGTSDRDTVGIGFYLANSVLYDLQNRLIGYTPSFVTDAAITGQLNVTNATPPLGLAGVISGSGGVTVSAGGMATLSGTNTYTGATAIQSGGLLALTGPGSISASSRVLSNGVFDVSQSWNPQAIGALLGSGSVYLGGRSLTVGNGGLFSGVIFDGGLGGGGGGSLVIAGGRQVLTGANTYTGGTTITGGATLAINADAALGAPAGPLTFDDGTLQALSAITMARPIIVAGGGGTINAGGYTVSLNGPLTVNGPFDTMGTVLLSADETVGGTMTVSSGLFSDDGTLTAGALVVAPGAELRGTGLVAAPTSVAGTLAPGNSPGTLTFAAPVTMLPGSTTQFDIDGTGTATGAGNYGRVVVTGQGNGFTAAGTLAPVLRGITGSATNSYVPPLGQGFVVVTTPGGAQGSVQGSYTGLAQPAGLAPGSRFDALYGPNTIALVVTPQSYGALGLAGIPQTANQAAVGAALDAGRPVAGVAMTPAQAALYAPIYPLPGSAIPGALEALAPTIDADGMMVWRDAWYLVGGAIGGAMETRRGGQPDSQEQTAEGPKGSTIWLTALGQFANVGSANGVPGYSGSTGGVAAGVDMPVLPWLTAGAALAFTSPQVGSKNGQNFSGQALQVAAYGSAHLSVWFLDMQFGGMFLQDSTQRPLPVYGVQANGQTSGTGVGGSIKAGAHLPLGAWQVEPSLGLAGVGVSQAGFTETQAGAASLTVGSQGLASIQSVLAARIERRFSVSEAMALVPTARLGWLHEFADTTGIATASFAGSGAPFSVQSASVGRDAALLGVGATLQTGGPVNLYLAYNGAFAQNANTQTLTGGVSVKW